MKELFNRLDEITPSLHGWGDANKAQTLAAMVVAIRPTVSLEIGIYGGRTFFGLALAHKFIGHGMAIGIDPWSNAAASEGYEGDNLEFWKTCPLDTIYESFIQKVSEFGVQNVTTIHRMKSDDAPLPDEIGVLHLDGQHTEQAVRDVLRFAPKVHVGGIVIMDDTEWKNLGDAPVHRAVSELKAMGFKELYPLGTGAVFQRR
jgi:hypothetical protein